MQYYLKNNTYEDAVISYNILSSYDSAYDNENCTVMSYTVRLSGQTLYQAIS